MASSIAPAATPPPSVSDHILAQQPVSFQQFLRLSDFKRAALPLLGHDVLRNTLAMTQLDSIQQQSDDAPDADATLDDVAKAGATLALMACSQCSARAAVVAGRNKSLNYNACYVSAGACEHIAARLGTEYLSTTLRNCDKVTLPAAAARHLRDAQQQQSAQHSALRAWPLDLQLHLMVDKRNAAPTAQAAEATPPAVPPPPAASATATTTATATASPATTTPAAAAPASAPAPATEQQQVLRQCAADDTELVVAFTAQFLKDGFGLDDTPPDEQVETSVAPRLQKGLYYVLLTPTTPADNTSSAATENTAAATTTASSGDTQGGAVCCLVGHTPSSSCSTRITLVYTPPEHRGHGYAKTAVRELVALLTGQLGYSSICLVADKEEPHVVSLYKGLGFEIMDELHSLRRPEEEDGPPTVTTTTTTTSAPQAPGAAAGDGDATLN